jgi:hypothetical protein
MGFIQPLSSHFNAEVLVFYRSDLAEVSTPGLRFEDKSIFSKAPACELDLKP